jgi:hypothetical protein
MSKKKKTKKADPADLITIPFVNLVLSHGEIGIHRGRKHGFRDVFGFRTLQNVPIAKLAKKVKAAYEGTDVPRHKGWPAQQETLRWFVDQGVDALYQLKADVLVYKEPDGIYALADGNHRALALYILGADSVRAKVIKRKPVRMWSRVGGGSQVVRAFRPSR